VLATSSGATVITPTLAGGGAPAAAGVVAFLSPQALSSKIRRAEGTNARDVRFMLSSQSKNAICRTLMIIKELQNENSEMLLGLQATKSLS
jgi:hypothetical protein